MEFRNKVKLYQLIYIDKLITLDFCNYTCMSIFLVFNLRLVRISCELFALLQWNGLVQDELEINIIFRSIGNLF